MEILTASIGPSNVNYEITFPSDYNKNIDDINKLLPEFYGEIVLIFDDLEIHTKRGKNSTYLQAPKKCLRNGQFIKKLTQKKLLDELSLNSGDKISFIVEENKKVFRSISHGTNIKTPENIINQKIPQDILTSRGQKEFRCKLLEAYQGRCAITGCDTEPALEAAHIIPHSEKQSYDVTRGILLRADIHTLFDLHLISVNPQTKKVVIGKSCQGHYGTFKGKLLSLPINHLHLPEAFPTSLS